MRDHLVFYLNGQRRRVAGAAAFATLTEHLREEERLVGTKVVCAEGDCGACTVLVGRPLGDRLEYRPIDACIAFLHQIDAAHVVTVEGLARNGHLHPVQEALVEGYGSQCGFCTPGIVMSLAGCLETGGLDEARSALAGNLCRCTGYLQILESAAAVNASAAPRLADLYSEAAMVEELAALEREPVSIAAAPRELFVATDLETACEFKARHAGCAVIAGATDLAVRRNKGSRESDAVLALGPRIRGFDRASIRNDVLLAGAGATWSRLRELVAERIPELARILDRFGAPQIRNAATIGGNLANASPIADSLPFLYVMGATVALASPRGARRVAIESFYRGYKQLDLQDDELIASVETPLPRPDDELRLYKVSRRRALDIATFNAAVLMRRAGGTIESARLAYGGVGPTVVRLPRAEAWLAGRSFTLETLRQAGEIAAGEIAPISDVRGSASYRRRLAANILARYFGDLGSDARESAEAARDRDRVLPARAAAPPRGAAASVPVAPAGGSPHPPHDSARGHVTGSALYVEDLPRLERELWLDFVPSPCANGRLRAIDATAARAIAGVVGVYTHADIPGINHFGPIFADEPFLPADRVSYVGQPLAVIAAESRSAARAGREAVRVTIDEETPVLTIEDADARGLFLGVERRIARGDLAAGFARADLVLEGVFESGGQEQFYLESQVAQAWAGENGEIFVHSSTQNPSEVQTVVAEVLGRGQHQVVCLVRRMGGGFGGKETQATIPALMAALVVDRTGRPARVAYSKDDDMRSTGKRHPYRTDYRVGCDRRGRILAAELRFRSNGGAFADLSTAVLERTMFHADNAYYLEAVDISGRVCRTNLPPNTAFRGFGGPQGMAVIESVMQEIAARLGLDALEVRRANLYAANPSPDGEAANAAPADAPSPAPRSLTPYGQEVRDFHVPAIFDRLEASASYRERAAAIARWNASGATRLRGIAMTPVKFGISYTTTFLNQGNALVQVLTDGTVQVSTGATEMGQGVNTKIAQLVATELGLDPSRVLVLVTSTERNANTSPTAASASTDLNGTAAVRAAAAIRDRLAALAATLLDERRPVPVDRVRFAGGEVFDDRDPQRSMTFAALTDRARRERVDLGARGFYATPGIHFDREAGRGSPFYYFTTGGAVAEISIDRLTGELTVEAVDALMDAGEVLNAGIERGQGIGGLVQGIGWVSTEELVWSEQGELLSHSPTTYKIPDVDDVPARLRFDFLESTPNRKNLRGMKALGEPPLMLGLSVWAAVLHALSFVAPGEAPRLTLPATSESILLAIEELERGAAASKAARELTACRGGTLPHHGV